MAGQPMLTLPRETFNHQAERKSYTEAQPGEFTIARPPCPRCGQQRVRLDWSNPPAIAAAERTFAPPGGAEWLRFFRDPPTLCSACAIRYEVGRLFSPGATTTIQDPVQAELAALRAQLAQRPKSQPDAIEGALFPTGEAMVTRHAARLLGGSVLFSRDPVQPNGMPYVGPRPHDNPGAVELQGRRVFPAAILARHVSREQVPELRKPALEEARRLGPMAPREHQNALAAADGVGSVITSWPVRIADRSDEHLTCWTVLSEPGPVTLAFTRDDRVDSY